MQLFFAYLPIISLIYLMTKQNGLPSYQAIPISALMIYVLNLVLFQFEPVQIHAVVLKGLLVAWTPITIIAGAIFLFRTMEATGALSTIQHWLNGISANPVAQLMIVGWAFQFNDDGR
jgi:lactate permease